MKTIKFIDIKNILEKNSHEVNFVTSTGGGCILRQQNIKILKEGLVVYLKISINAQYERVKNRTHRPLLNGSVTKEDLARLDEERGSIYSDISDIEVDVSNFNKEEWVNIKNDSLRKFIFNESIKKYDDKKLNREISALYSNLSNEFSDFNSPKIITLNNGIDYQFKIIN